MGLYKDTFLFNASVFFAYPLEVGAVVFRRACEIGIVLLFWMVVARSAPGTVNFRQITAYFLVSTAVNQTVMATRLNLATWLRSVIKRGEISSYLIKPVSIIPYVYVSWQGRNVLVLALSLTVFCLSFVLDPPASAFALVAFAVFLGLAFLLSLAVNILMGALAFVFTEVSGIQHSAMHVIRVLSGSMIPLTLFPGGLRTAALLSPFPGMVFGPTHALRYAGFGMDVARDFAINASWAVALMALSLFVWNRCMRAYDAVGI